MAIRLIILLLISVCQLAHGYDQFGFNGSLLSPMSQNERDTLTYLTGGVMIYNQDKNLYEYWDGAAWREIGSGGGSGPATPGVIEGARWNTFLARPLVNTASFFMLNEPENTVAECGFSVNDADDGIYFELTQGCLVTSAFNMSAGGQTFYAGFSLNPLPAEIQADFELLDVSKVLCKQRVRGLSDETTGCTVTYAARAGDRIYFHGPISGTFGAVDLFNVSFAATVGGSGTGGNVSGIAPTLQDNIAIWRDTGGTLIEDSGIAISDIVTTSSNIVGGPATTNIFAIPGWADTTGTSLSNSEFYFIATDATQAMEHVVGYANNPAPGRISFRSTDNSGATVAWVARDFTNSYDVRLPRDPPNVGDVMVSDSIGQLRWQPNGAGGVSGGIVGPAVTNFNHVALWNSIDGTILKESNYEIPVGDGTANQVLVTDGAGTVSWDDQAGGNPLPTDNTEAGKVLLSDGTDNPAWLAYPPVDSVLSTDNAGNTIWETKVNFGDVTGPAVSVNDNLVLFAGTSGKLIKDSGQALADFGDVKGPVTSDVGAVPTYANTTGKLIQNTTLLWNGVTHTVPGNTNTLTLGLDGTSGRTTLRGANTITNYTLTFPSTGPTTNNQFLVADNTGSFAWGTAPTGSVNGPAPAVSTHQALAMWDGASGRLLMQTSYVFPQVDGLIGQVPVAQGNGIVAWTHGGSGYPSSVDLVLPDLTQIVLDDDRPYFLIRVEGDIGPITMPNLPFIFVDVDLSGNTTWLNGTKVVFIGNSDVNPVTFIEDKITPGGMWMNGDVTVRDGWSHTLIYDAVRDRWLGTTRSH